MAIIILKHRIWGRHVLTWCRAGTFHWLRTERMTALLGWIIKKWLFEECAHTTFTYMWHETASVCCHQTRGHVTPVTLPVSVSRLWAQPHPCHGHGHPHHSGASHRPGLWLVTGSSSGPWLAGRASLSPATNSVRAPGHGTRRTDQWSEPESRDQRVASGGRGTIPDTG